MLFVLPSHASYWLRVTIFLAVLLLALSPARAAIELLFLKSPHHPEVLLIPKRSEESSVAAIQAFEAAVKASKGLAPYYENIKSLESAETTQHLPANWKAHLMELPKLLHLGTIA